MPPLLILFIHLGLGGVQRKIIDIVNYLGKTKPDLKIVILLRNNEKFNLIPEITNRQVRIISYQDWQAKTKLKVPLFFPFFVIYQIWAINPSAILAFLDFVSLPAIWAKMLFFWRPVKLVLSEDHYASKIIPTFFLGRCRNLLVKIFYPLADIVFTCSEATRQDLIRHYRLKPAKVKVVVNWTTFRYRGFKTKGQKYDLIYLGRLVKSKNLGLLLRVLKKIKDEGRNLKLCLAGSGKDQAALEVMARKFSLQKNVLFMEPTLKVEQLLSEAKVFVYCSEIKAEGYPMAILEAMAVGLPVLSRKFAGAGEFLHDNENCLLFETEEEFRQKLVRLVSQPELRRKLVVNSQKYLEKYHSSRNIEVYLASLDLAESKVSATIEAKKSAPISLG